MVVIAAQPLFTALITALSAPDETRTTGACPAYADLPQNVLAKTNDGFNLSMPTIGQVATKRFAKPEIVALKCDVHPCMGARIGVFDHPWFAVTDAKGAFALSGVPPGRYTLTAWHESLGERTAEVTVPEKGTVETSFGFAAR